MSSTTFIVFKDKLGAKITHTITQTRYVWLNIIRILNIASLLIVVAASIATITRTFIVSKFFFFDAATQIIRALIAVFLIATETPWFVAYFTREWACFGNNHGFSMLSCAMTCLGVNILGDLNCNTRSQQALGLSFWSLIFASGILMFTMAVLNLISGYICRDRAQGQSAREVRHPWSHVVTQKKFDPESQHAATRCQVCGNLPVKVYETEGQEIAVHRTELEASTTRQELPASSWI